MGVEEIHLLILGITELNKFALTIGRAQAEGREVSAAEIQQFRNSLSEAFTAADVAYEKAIAEGR
jgi:hypothetical protein